MRQTEFTRNLATGTYDLIVLDVLRDGPAYGYGILKRILAQSKNTIRWEQGTLYPVLHHLEEQGLVTSDWKGRKGSRQRRYYRLTARGNRVWHEQRAQWRAFTAAVNNLLRA
jgi:PadR family transcriptional regulator, regulatory protein PadR